MLKISYAGCLGLSPAILSQFIFNCALQSKIVKNLFKTLILWVQGPSRSSMFINLKSPPPLLVMISSMFGPICNFFHTKRANSGKIASFKGGKVSLRDAFVWGKPPHTCAQNCNKKTKDLGSVHSEDFEILAWTFLIGLQSVTVTHRERDAKAMAKTHSCRA